MQGNRPFVQKENFLVAKSARLGGFCLFLWTLVACSPTHGLVPLPQATGFYRLGAGDQVRVLTYNDPQLSNTFFVADTGTIAFPLIGIVQAAGETPQSLANELTKTLSSRGLLRDPSVSVEVMKYRPVFILGEVSKPGQYQYIPGMTMQSAVALAGGYTYRAITNTASAVRTEGINGNHPVNGRIIPETLLAPGDVVTIYERYF
ncbi:polysaccharide export protein [Acetobacter sp. LMG 1636]|uniref:Polysaccharide export protein n=2 Tax=Acetobacter fallax TaxID=1737473 RepID=A0ABX0K7K7_9PROT|nr:polysaccharide biosynthesis/export family protein [Acetobacter fallax]NHO32314.1 polysaccharide export protein [Acetobacter fallax]NHO35874.1 polysaccharide export protein [Acetobacter fallax]